jgi:hypothetical protein
MRAGFVDQGNIGALAATELIPEPGDELEPAGAPAHHNDLVKS